MMRGLACLAMLLAAGCGTEEKVKPPPAKKKPPGPPRLERIDVKSLPKLADPFPVDDGRIEVARPDGWQRETSRLNNVVYLCRQSVQSSYPRIYVFAEHYPLDHVDANNVQQFAESIRSQLKLDQREIEGEVTAAIIGEFAGASYRRRGKDREGRLLDRVFLVTVAGGRKYTVELQAIDGTLKPFLPHLYAMAAGINFSPAKESMP